MSETEPSLRRIEWTVFVKGERVDDVDRPQRLEYVDRVLAEERTDCGSGGQDEERECGGERAFILFESGA